jgi:hypothetical protein
VRDRRSAAAAAGLRLLPPRLSGTGPLPPLPRPREPPSSPHALPPLLPRRRGARGLRREADTLRRGIDDRRPLPPRAARAARPRDRSGRPLSRLVRPGLRRRGRLPVHLLVPAGRHLPAQGRPGPGDAAARLLGPHLQAAAAAHRRGRARDAGRGAPGAPGGPLDDRDHRRDRLRAARAELGADPAGRGLLRRGGDRRLGLPALLVAVDPGSGLPAVAAADRGRGHRRPSAGLVGAPGARRRVHRGARALLRLVGALHRHPAGDRLLRHLRTPVGVRGRLPAGSRAAGLGGAPGAHPRPPTLPPPAAAGQGRGGLGGDHRSRLLRSAGRRAGGLPRLDRRLAARLRRARALGGHHRAPAQRGPPAGHPSRRGTSCTGRC